MNLFIKVQSTIYENFAFIFYVNAGQFKETGFSGPAIRLLEDRVFDWGHCFMLYDCTEFVEFVKEEDLPIGFNKYEFMNFSSIQLDP